MDPITAIGVAAAVVQFTDFGSRLLTDAMEVYNSVSGQTLEDVELVTISNDLQLLCRGIQDKSSRLTDPRQGPSSSEQTLLRLCSACLQLTQELDVVIKQLRARGSGKLKVAVESFAVALRKFWSREEIANFRLRISDVRQQMMMAMLTFLWEESKSGANDIQQLSHQQAEMITTLNQIDHNTRTLDSKLIQLIHGSMSNQDWEHREAVRSIWSSSWSSSVSPQMFPQMPGPQGVQANVAGSEEGSDSFCIKSIIESLLFEDLSIRESAIIEAYKSTFEWLLKEPRNGPDGEPLWSDFGNWLSGPSTDIYWMTGKPGSGKSTLMKFISNHAMLNHYLSEWSQSQPYLLGTFYFWNAGSPMQKTQEGLLRTLLYQCLSQRPQIVPKVCPRRWALFKLFGKKALRVAPDWEWQELMESFSALDLLVGTDFNLALFIDGLDEFDGSHEKLIEFIKLFHSHPGTKICVSSRPWNVFEDAFRCSPGLKLEALTGGDIGLYVHGMFSSTPAFQELRDALPSEADNLKKGIIEKSQGVFLWVTVVVLAIIEGISEGDKLSAMQAMVDELPTDLSELYARIWLRIKPKYVTHSAQLFQIYKESLGPLDVVTLWLADEEDPFKTDINTLTPQQRSLIRQNMKRRLNSRTRGLLEVSQEGRVDFLHRSVRDWVNLMWPDIYSKTSPEFDPNLALLKAATVEILDEKYWKAHVISVPDYFWLEVRKCLLYGSKVRDHPQNSPILVDVLDRLDKECAKISMSYALGNSLPPVYAEAISSNCPYERKSLPHWSTTQRRDGPDNSFLGLAAQFAILPYVRIKASADPQILIPGPIDLPILQSAIHGFEYFTQRQIVDLDKPLSCSDLDTRYKLIQFLLDTETNAVRGDSKRMRKKIARHKDVYRKLAEAPIKLGFTVLPDGSQMKYHDAVCRLLEQHGGFKGEDTLTWKTSPNFVKGILKRFKT